MVIRSLFFKIAFVLGIIIFFIGLSHYTSLRKWHTPQKTKDHFYSDLQNHKTNILNEFKQKGVTQSKIKKISEPKLPQNMKAQTQQINHLSDANKKLVGEVLDHFGLSSDMPILPSKDDSPASASNTALYINEVVFDQLSEPAKRFVIGHEAQHILHQDVTEQGVVQQCFSRKRKNNSLHHPTSKYSRFLEKRADIETALQGPEWAEGYVQFMQSTYKRNGENPGITHPLNTKRLQLAKNICEHMNTGCITNPIYLT